MREFSIIDDVFNLDNIIVFCNIKTVKECHYHPRDGAETIIRKIVEMNDLDYDEHYELPMYDWQFKPWSKWRDIIYLANQLKITQLPTDKMLAVMNVREVFKKLYLKLNIDDHDFLPEDVFQDSSEYTLTSQDLQGDLIQEKDKNILNQ